MSISRTDDGVGISYKIAGPGPRNVLLLHGWGGSENFWDDVTKHLDLTALRVIALSYRGHGDSDKAMNGYTLEQFARDVLSVADHAGARKFVLVGFSMGGKFAQYMAAAEPERILGLVLVAPVGADYFPMPEETARSFCEAAGSRERAAEVLAPLRKLQISPTVTDAFVDDFVKIPRVALEGTIKMFAGASFLDQAKEISTPTLVISGAYDPVVTPDYIQKQIVSRLARKHLVTLPCGHDIPLEMPDESAALITAFLAGLP
jgi:non-heme chloroperoxidase